jgi:hypothetical protein
MAQPAKLSKEEEAVLRYFLKNKSVGEIIAIRELQVLEGIKDPLPIINSLIEKGYLVKGRGCYNINSSLLKKNKI